MFGTDFHGTYDPAKVIVTVAERIVSGFADGEFLTVVMDDDIYQKIRGADGEVSRTRNISQAGVIELTLLASAPSNGDLNGLIAYTEPVTIGVTDLSGNTVVLAHRCWIKKAPDLAFGKEIGNTVWTFDCASIQTDFGGAQNNSFLSGLLG
jgi:hypothetical protein